MKYKLIISDYGETLVHSGDKVSTQNVEAIRMFQQHGGLFSIATGREWQSIKRKIQKSDLSSLQEILITCCYGSMIISSISEKVIFDAPLNLDLVKDLENFLLKNKIEYSLVTKDKTLIEKSIDISEYKWKKPKDILLFDNLEDLIQHVSKNNERIYKIDIYSLSMSEKVAKYINDKYIEIFKYYINKQGFMEIVSSDAGKEKAYNFIRDYYELKDKEVIVVGDAPNDLGLFKYALNRVAVSNAIGVLLDQSTYIVDNEGYIGISRLISKILNDVVI